MVCFKAIMKYKEYKKEMEKDAQRRDILRKESKYWHARICPKCGSKNIAYLHKFSNAHETTVQCEDCKYNNTFDGIEIK